MQSQTEGTAPRPLASPPKGDAPIFLQVEREGKGLASEPWPLPPPLRSLLNGLHVPVLGGIPTGWPTSLKRRHSKCQGNAHQASWAHGPSAPGPSPVPRLAERHCAPRGPCRPDARPPPPRSRHRLWDAPLSFSQLRGSFAPAVGEGLGIYELKEKPRT